MKDLPRVYANPIDKELNNYQKETKLSNEFRHSSEKNLSMKIRDIFKSSNFIYKSRVRITTKEGQKEKVIVGKTENALLTMDGEKIKIIDIYDIEKI